jgi:hypothetical protein
VRDDFTTAEKVIVVAGTVALVFSFFPWLRVRGGHTSAWGAGLFPTYTLVPLLGLAMAAQIAATRFGGVKFPERVGDFSWPQLHLIAGAGASVIAICFLLIDKGPLQIGFGYIIDLLAALALLVGALLLRQERAATT